MSNDKKKEEGEMSLSLHYLPGEEHRLDNQGQSVIIRTRSSLCLQSPKP